LFSYIDVVCSLSKTSGVFSLPGIFYTLGKKLGPRYRKARWVWQSFFGSERERTAAENALGHDLADEIRSQVRLCDPSLFHTDITDLGMRLSQGLRNQQRSFVFTIMKQSPANAFALPGGFVFITDSMMTLCHDYPDHLAFILAHEMGHIVRGHAMERIMINTAVSYASGLTSVRSAVGAWVKRVGMSALTSAYTQDQELEADTLAVRLTRAARFDPKGGERLFEKLAQTCSAQNTTGLAQYFGSHPPIAQRIQHIRRCLH
jgi:predicted Zn-dependent protease